MHSPTVPSVNAALQVARQLADLRQALGAAVVDVAVTERQLAFERAMAEKTIADLAGGEKNLGANEDTRRRAYTIGLEVYDSYVAARTMAEEAEANRRMCEVDVKLAQDQLAILLAALAVDITEIPAALLADPAADASCAASLPGGAA